MGAHLVCWQVEVLLVTDDLPHLLQTERQSMARQLIIAHSHQAVLPCRYTEHHNLEALQMCGLSKPTVKQHMQWQVQAAKPRPCLLTILREAPPQQHTLCSEILLLLLKVGQRRVLDLFRMGTASCFFSIAVNPL